MQDAHHVLHALVGQDRTRRSAFDTHTERAAVEIQRRGHAEQYAYDAAGRPTTVTDPLTNVWQTVYDPAGRIDHTIDAEGQQTDYAYDQLGRVETMDG